MLALRSYLLHYVIVRCTSHHEDPVASGDGPAASAMRSMLMATLAVLIKRSWLDPEGRPKPAADAAFFQEMAAMSQTGVGMESDQRIP